MSTTAPMTEARLAAIAAAEAAGHGEITPRDPNATREDIISWVRMRHAGAVVLGDAALAEALRVYAEELGLELR